MKYPRCMYTIVDADTGERFSTADYASYDVALRERNRLALSYGKEFCLVVWSVDQEGVLHEISHDK